jgi:Prolyl oligopeptidase family/Oxidoreductase family, NAD-binding Rossmann fold
VIGCGVRAAVRCDGVERLPAACLHAYADVKQEAADGFLATYGGAHATTDAARILADPEVDAFLICTWHDTYAAYAIQAAQGGKKMLSEKALLLIHAEPDMNCGIGQSEELYAALQALGRPVSLVNIPSEGHLMNLAGTPSHRLLRMAAIDEWPARWL